MERTSPPFKIWRLRLGFSQSEAANALGKTVRCIQFYDSGVFDPPYDTTLAMRWIEHQQTSGVAA